MTKWKDYYSTPAQLADRTDYLKQVGHTLNGKSISHAHFQLMVDQVCRELDLQADDCVLDLCCGNGYLTKELAKVCGRIVGVDFSDNLVQIATEDHGSKNANYVCMDVLDLDTSKLVENGPFSKILLYAALQHFDKKDLRPLLEKVLEVATPNPTILFGFVPDRGGQSTFYGTFKRKRERIWRILMGTEILKTWWDRKFMEHVCQGLGLRCTFHELDNRLDAAQYRFNVVINSIDD
jgi:cyclopropane fatty-acyl-phospholipid synthase-like methyltransferase